MFFSSIKEINRLLIKGMSNVIDVIIDKKYTQNFDFLNLKNVWGAQTHADITEFSNFLLQLKNQRPENKAMCGCSIIFYPERSYDTLSSKSLSFLLNKNIINFNKNEMESKIENLTHSFREINLVF